VNLSRYERKNKQMNYRQYDQLDYSDVTHGNHEGQLNINSGLTNNNHHRNKRNSGSNVAQPKAFAELKPEQFLPHQMLAKVNHIENG
jgi:hypothetical protein